MTRWLHAATLVFTSYWLIATSAPPEPARECYTGLPDRASIAVQLDGPIDDGAGTSTPSAPSCVGLDGMLADGVFVLDLVRGPRPRDNGGACHGYELASVDGLGGVSVTSGRAINAGGELVAAAGSYTSSTEVGCRGSWRLVLTPETLPPRGQTIDPLAAGPNQRWRIERSITLDQAQFCSGFDVRGVATCSDVFSVQSITVMQ